MSDQSPSFPSSDEGLWSTLVVAIFIIGLFICLAAGMLLVVLQVIALIWGSSSLSIWAEAALAPASGISASVACVASLVYYWCHHRMINA